MLDRLEQLLGVGHLGQVAVEVAGPRQPLPELAIAIFRLERRGMHPEDFARAGVEIGEHAVAIEEQVRLPFRHQKRAGSSATAIGLSICSQPRSRSTSLLSRALRSGPSDQVMW